MNTGVTRYALALDLVDDAQAIADYEKAHAAIWPEVGDHLRSHGVIGMEIYRLGTRLFMVMEVDPAVYSAESMAQAALNPDFPLACSSRVIGGEFDWQIELRGLIPKPLHPLSVLHGHSQVQDLLSAFCGGVGRLGK